MTELNFGHLNFKSYSYDKLLDPPEFNLPKDALDRLCDCFPCFSWTSYDDLSKAEKICHRLSRKLIIDSSDGVYELLTKLKELSSFLKAFYAKCLKVRREEEEKLALAYYEFVKKVPCIKDDPSYESLTYFDKFKIDEALEALLLENPQKEQIGVPQQSVRSHLEVLSEKVQSFDYTKIPGSEHVPTVSTVLDALNRMIQALEKAALCFPVKYT